MEKKSRIQKMAVCSLFTALTAVGAFIRIPVPVVPFTLQFLFTMLAGLLLGGRLGAVSVGAYAILGLAGLPIFAEGGGFWYVLKPSFGYILGFILAAYVTGRLTEKLEGLKKAQEFMKAINAHYRKHGTCHGIEGLSEEQAEELDHL